MQKLQYLTTAQNADRANVTKCKVTCAFMFQTETVIYTVETKVIDYTFEYISSL